METQEWLSVRDVASRVGLTEERIRQLIRAQEIRATKLGGWLVRPEDLNEFIQSRTNMSGRLGAINGGEYRDDVAASEPERPW